MPPEESPLDRLNRRLYQPQPVETVTPPPLRREVPQPMRAPAPVWQPPPPPLPRKVPTGWRAMPWTSRFLIIALGFFVIAGGAAAFIFFHGTRAITSDHLHIDAQGPVSIASGDTVAIVITIRNDNPATVTGATLFADLPAGTRRPDDTSQPLDHYTDSLGDLPPGAETSRTITAVMFGAQNEQLTVPISVTFSAEGSNGQFRAEGQYQGTITSSPLAVTVSAPQEAASGEPFTLAITARNNATAPLQHVGLAVTYPPGFQAASTDPKPLSGTLFGFGTLAPGASQTVTIRGTLTGQNTDVRVFRITGGTRSSDEALDITLPYASTEADINVAKPFLGTSLALNHDTGDTVLAAPGQIVSGSVTWQNNSNAPVSDAQITIHLSGNGFDPAQVFTQSGFYRSSDATILFSKDTQSNLGQLLPGDTGNGTFTFTPKTAAALKGVPNPTITLTVSIAGNRTGAGNVPEKISSTETKTVKVGTNVAFTTRVLRTVGPFKNTGVVPPKPNMETTYTIELSAVNSVNSLGGAQASMTLPSYVRFTGSVSPAGTVVYDDRTRTVTWKVNDLAGGASQKAYFQVALLPSASQGGTNPALVSEQTFTGTDRFTQALVTVKANQLTTNFSGDPGYVGGQGTVTQ